MEGEKVTMMMLFLVMLVTISKTLSNHIGLIQPESDRELCQSDSSVTFYTTSENLSAAIITDNVSLVSVCSRMVELKVKIVIESLERFALEGRSGNINCTGDGRFVFINIAHLSIQCLVLTGCSVMIESKEVVFLANINIFDIQILDSLETGLSFNNIIGLVVIHNCTFGSNRQHLSIKLVKKSEASFYEIANSSFNNAGNLPETFSDSYGGGLDLSVFESSHSAVRIASVQCNYNRAGNGGGVSMRYMNSFNCTVEIIDSDFGCNHAETGGGGLYLDMRSPLVISVVNCRFKGNEAQLGGGTRILSVRMKENTSSIEFTNVSWTSNVAVYGSAVYVIADPKYSAVSGFLPCVLLTNLSISNNIVKRLPLPENNDERLYANGVGSFYCSYFELHFSLSLSVVGNNGTAFHLESCTMHIKSHSVVRFAHNEGRYGGAMHFSQSQIVAGGDVKIYFVDNLALISGGAIYYYASLSTWSRFTNSCFIQKESSGTSRIVFNFTDNYDNIKDRSSRNSIYALSLRPCMTMFGLNETFNESTVFSSVGIFLLNPNGDHNHIKTASRYFSVNKLTKVIPGKPYLINIKSYNDFGKTFRSIISIKVCPDNKDSNITVFPYSILNNSNLTFYGDPGRGQVILSTYDERLINFIFNITIVNCPPGFYLDTNKSCSCLTNHNDIIKKCHSDSKTANRSQGMWVNHTINEDNLQGGFCPTRYCSNETLLIKINGTDNWNVCSEGRHGKLCGECVENYSVFYHSQLYTCTKNYLCHLGWLFYILVGIIPVTFFFLAITYSDISLSSGGINGFVFYSQVLLTLRVSGEDHFGLNPAICYAQGFQSLVYGVFNLDFFAHQSLKFCLWHGATSLSVMSMNYLTQAYSLALVFVIVMLLKYNHKLFLLVARLLGTRLLSINRSSIHGLSALMILSYSQNVAVSIALLRPGFIYLSNGSYTSVVHYYGSYVYGDHNHIKYAILASSSLVIFIIIPTCLLLIYPLHYKLLSFLHISEWHCIMRFTSPLEKMKPVFDSFQSTYKDEFRFFFGLYFLYRLVINLIFVINTPDNFYTVMEGDLLIIFIIHSMCQPFKQALHNVVNTLLIGNLLMINTISMFHLYHSHRSEKNEKLIFITSSVQLVLIYAPMVVALLIAGKKVTSKVARGCYSCNWCMKGWEDAHDDQLELDLVRERERSATIGSSSSYNRVLD